MIQRLLLNAILISTLISCGGKNADNIDKDKVRDLKKSLLNDIYFDSPQTFWLAQSLEFNKEIILENKIAQIERKIYGKTLKEENIKYDSTNTVLVEQRLYSFNKVGKITELELQFFDHGILLKKIKLKYFYKKNKDWLQDIKITEYYAYQADDRNVDFEFDPSNKNYKFYFQQKFENWGTVYSSKFSIEKVYLVKQKDNQINSYIASIVNPNPDDIVIWGNFNRPEKIYNLTGTVQESDVTEYHYYDNSDIIKTKLSTHYPFKVKRDYIYNKNGYCDMYIDSTFVNSQYLTHIETSIFSDKGALPKTITHLKKNENGGHAAFETFNYKYYP